VTDPTPILADLPPGSQLYLHSRTPDDGIPGRPTEVALDERIAALPSLPPSTTPLTDDLRDLVGRIRCECPGEEAAAVCAELLTVAETLARMEAP